MSMDDNDGQMIFGDLGGLKFPDNCLTGEEKPRKNLTEETCPDWGSNPGPLRDKRACYHLLHSGGLLRNSKFLIFSHETTLNFRGRGKTKKRARDIYKRALDIDFERDRSIGLGSTIDDGQTDRQTHTHTHTHTDTHKHTQTHTDRETYTLIHFSKTLF